MRIAAKQFPSWADLASLEPFGMELALADLSVPGENNVGPRTVCALFLSFVSMHEHVLVAAIKTRRARHKASNFLTPHEKTEKRGKAISLLNSLLNMSLEMEVSAPVISITAS